MMEWCWLTCRLVLTELSYAAQGMVRPIVGLARLYHLRHYFAHMSADQPDKDTDSIETLQAEFYAL